MDYLHFLKKNSRFFFKFTAKSSKYSTKISISLKSSKKEDSLFNFSFLSNLSQKWISETIAEINSNNFSFLLIDWSPYPISLILNSNCLN